MDAKTTCAHRTPGSIPTLQYRQAVTPPARVTWNPAPTPVTLRARLLTLELQPHRGHFGVLGGPRLRLQPPLHVVAAAQLPHGASATRGSLSETHLKSEPRRETSCLRMRKSRISGAERRSCRPDLTEREAVAEEAGRSPPTGGAYLIRRPGLEVVEQPRF